MRNTREIIDLQPGVRYTHCEKEMTIPPKGRGVCGPLSRFVSGQMAQPQLPLLLIHAQGGQRIKVMYTSQIH
jgi:hypothetical protein